MTNTATNIYYRANLINLKCICKFVDKVLGKLLCYELGFVQCQCPERLF